MKNRRHHVNRTEGKIGEKLADSSSEGMPEDGIGTKVLYNWLYQLEEENYFMDAKEIL